MLWIEDPIIKNVLLALSLIGYLISAVAFYSRATKSAMMIEENGSSIPAKVSLTIVEGGVAPNDGIQKAA